MKTLFSKFALTSLVALSSCALALAEDPKPAAGAGHRPGGAGREGHRPMDPEARAKEMQTTLGLSDDQTAKVKAVFEKNQQKNGEEMKKLREDTTLSQEDKRKKMGEAMAGTMEEIKAILTPEQQTKWKEAQEKRREEFQKRREAGGAKPDAKPGEAK